MTTPDKPLTEAELASAYKRARDGFKASSFVTLALLSHIRLRDTEVSLLRGEVERLAGALRMHEERDAPTEAEIAAGWPCYDRAALASEGAE